MSEEQKPIPIFDGRSGHRPQAEAQRYVYRMAARMLEHEFHPDEAHGWIFGGIETEVDQRRVKKALKQVITEMERRANRP